MYRRSSHGTVVLLLMYDSHTSAQMFKSPVLKEYLLISTRKEEGGKRSEEREARKAKGGKECWYT